MDFGSWELPKWGGGVMYNLGMRKWSVLFGELMRKRGLGEDFLSSKYEDLADPFLLPDMERAVERILEAGEKGEKVVIYGDYDVDGVTASVVMKEALGFAGVRDIEILLPDRFADGYGMNMGVVEKILKVGVGLVVTVDCGSGSGEVIAKLRERGVDCVVTDHHEIGEVPEAAVAVVNPKRENRMDSRDPSHHFCSAKDGEGLTSKPEDDERIEGMDLAGVGVAFKVAVAVNAKMNGGVCDGQEKWLLDLVALGTVCDAVPLVGENRILTTFGLKVLAKTRRVGLAELMKLAGVKRLDARALGFQIGPRLNASGRMRTAEMSLALLLETNRAKAFGLARELEELNKERKEMQMMVMNEIKEGSVGKEAVMVACGKWHEGVIGIVAGRMVEEYRRPCFVFAEMEGGLLKGSGRSFGDFSLADCITECQKLLVKGGGHNFACGVTIAKKDLDGFKTAVNEYYENLGLKNQQRFLVVEEDVVTRDLGELASEMFCEELALLEPYGEGNVEPVFKLQGVAALTTVAMGANRKHLKLNVRGGDGKDMKLVAFSAPKEWFDVVEGDRLDVLVNLELNEWNGVKMVEGKILGIEKVWDI